MGASSEIRDTHERTGKRTATGGGEAATSLTNRSREHREALRASLETGADPMTGYGALTAPLTCFCCMLYQERISVIGCLLTFKAKETPLKFHAQRLFEGGPMPSPRSNSAI